MSITIPQLHVAGANLISNYTTAPLCFRRGRFVAEIDLTGTPSQPLPS